MMKTQKHSEKFLKQKDRHEILQKKKSMQKFFISTKKRRKLRTLLNLVARKFAV